MLRSQQILLADARRLLQISGETRELGDDPARWRMHAISELCKLLKASVGMSTHARNFMPGQYPLPLIMVSHGWRGQTEEMLFHHYMTDPELPQEPGIVAVVARKGQDHVHTRTQLVKDRDWYANRLTNELRIPADIDHFLISCRWLGDGELDQLIFHRPPGAPDFSDRERTLVGLFHDELKRTWMLQRERVRRATALPPYLLRVAERLMAGRSEKEAAHDLGLSRHTVHQYVKELHRRTGAASRGELLARLLPRQAEFVPKLGP